MPGSPKQALKVFLCHASGDKPHVRDLYKRLVREGIDAWLDQEKLLPGQDWRVEIPRAVQEADVVVICLSNKSITKEGYIQKEIKFALDSAEEKPDGTIFLIPARIEDCPVPEKLSRWQWVDLFEENGYIKLLRSLKLRADRVGATVSPSSYEDTDAETERRLDQYYTEGLAAFYTEDWNRACQRFQSILSERPNHKNALEKLGEAERRRDLSNLYAQATSDYQAQNWAAAIATLNELLKKSPEYKDAAELLKYAKKQEQLGGLYFEAKKLHDGKKWQAVLRVFEQIHALEPDHPDPDRLLSSAQKEAAELKRLAELNDLYSSALREMDLGKWQDARALLEQVHKSQTGFLETERLLSKVEDEIRKVEEQTQRTNQINTLYEQAHGLVRAKSWRKAQEKIDEIRKLNSQFEDRDGVVEKVNAALMQEEQEAQKQNQLAALYAEAVRLLKEKNYAEALAKWEEVRVIDPKYPDRQWVQRTARRELAKAGRSAPARKTSIPWKIIIPGLVVLGGILFVILNSSVFSPSKPRTEFPIHLYIYTSSDILEVRQMEGGGRLTNITLNEASPEGSLNEYKSGVFSMSQPLENATGGSGMEMSLEATLVDVEAGGDLVFSVDAGCYGETTVEVWNALDNPALVKSFTWINPCDGSTGKYKVPVDLFTSDVGTLSESGITLPLPHSSYEWYFDEGNDGWGVRNENDISAPDSLNGYLTFNITGKDPFLYSPENLRIYAEETPIITIRMRVRQGGLAGIFFLPLDGEESYEKVSEFQLVEDSVMYTYDVDMSESSMWNGTISRIRLDPVQNIWFLPQKIEIDYIIIHAP